MDTASLLAEHIAQMLGLAGQVARLRRVAGGCISEAAVLECGETRYFVKHNDAARRAMFEAEADGLTAIRATGTVRAPAPLGTGVAAGRAFLIMEYLALAPLTDTSQEALGRALGAMHRTTAAAFGWHRDNTIGSTPQPNTNSGDWVNFWCRHRLGFQLRLAETAAPGRRLIANGERLLLRLPALFDSYRPCASLLHGDLWSGNAAQTSGAEPVVFDPAVYYGDREADLAMTELFGGFGERFYSAYRETWALDPGYRVRRDLYNLYHVLNHANLLGGAYWAQGERLIDRLLAETG